MPKRGEYWRAKAELARISIFKDNAFFDDEVEYDVVLPSGERIRDRRSQWAFGYGPFGFNPNYFLPYWDAEAPPWIFCNDDGLIAIISAIWAARSQQKECVAQGFGDSYEVVNRRFSSGHCRPRESRAHLFRKRARSVGLDPSRRARLGKKWPEQTANREAILDHMRRKASMKGLLSQGTQRRYAEFTKTMTAQR